jgi:diacylglycerol kinase (ATP)
MQEKALIIFNPQAGGFKREAVLRAISRHFTSAGIDFELYETDGKDTLGPAIQQWTERGCSLFVVAGGDGTVSSTAGALAGSSIPIGIVPVGTGNILARDLRIPLNIDDAVRLLAGEHALRTIDAMRIDGALYFLIAGVGISSFTVRDIKGSDKRRFGLLAYVTTAIRKLFEFKSTGFEVIVDGETHRFQAAEVAVANSSGVADMVLPHIFDIHVDDGYLDVIIIAARTPFDYPRIVFNALRGHKPSPSVHFFRAKESVVIRSENPLPVQADGDLIGTSPVEVEVVPHAVKVIVPCDANAGPGSPPES